VFYRRKLLLALLEVFSGSLTRTDCQKLLFLFCLHKGKNYYDFFPYKYGGFSFMLYQDKGRLTSLGLLAAQQHFELCSKQSFISELRQEDRLALLALKKEVGDLRGEKLIRKAYIEYPYYASRSEIASKVLESVEYENVSKTWNTDKAPSLFTIGYEGMSIDAYFNVLLANNVVALVDVRKNPLSMKYGFSKTKFSNYAKNVGIQYSHIPELGIPSTLRQELTNPSAYSKLFEYYSSEILPNQGEAVQKLKEIVQEQGRVVITCFEADHRFCHRHKLAEYLKNDTSFSVPVVHLCRTSIGSAQRAYSSDESFPSELWDKNMQMSLFDS